MIQYVDVRYSTYSHSGPIRNITNTCDKLRCCTRIRSMVRYFSVSQKVQDVKISEQNPLVIGKTKAMIQKHLQITSGND